MVRTVKVRLELDRDDYKRGLRDAANETRGFDGEVRSAGKDLGAMGVEVKATGTKVDSMGREVDAAAKKTTALGDEAAKTKAKTTGLGEETKKTRGNIVDLAKDIDATKASLKALGEEFQKTGKINIDELNKLNATLRDLERAKAALDKLTPAKDTSGDRGGVTTARMRELATEIEHTQVAIKELSSAWVRTRSSDIGPMLRSQQDALRSLRAEYEKAKTDAEKGPGLFSKILSLGGSSIPNSAIKAAESSGLQAGDAFGGGFLSSAGAVLSAGAPALVPVAVGIVAMALAAASGAALGALGGAGIAAGIVAQFSDPRVKGAAVDLGAYLKGQLVEATSGFAAPFTSGIAALKREMAPLWQDLQKGFKALEPYVSFLLVKIGEGLAKLGPGLGRAMEAAGPLIGTIAKNIPTLLNGINIFFDEISKGGKGASESIDMLFKVISATVAGLGFLLRAAANVYDFFVQAQDKITGALAKIPGLGKAFEPLAKYSHGVATSFDESKISADGASGSLDAFTGSAGAAAGAAGGLGGAAQGMSASMSASIASMTGLDGAAISMNQSVQSLKDSIAQNGTSLDINTKSGQANVQAMLSGVQSAEALRQAQINSGLSAAYADDQYMKNVESLRQVMLNAGMNKDAVDAMIQKYLNVPGMIKTNVELSGAIDAITKGATLRDILNSLDGKVSRAEVITTYLSEKDAASGGPSAGGRKGVITYNRWGGAFEHAAVGVLRDASVYSSVSTGARYAFAEPQTQGEAFIPKNGDLERSRGIWSYVGANWLGMRSAPMPTGGAATHVQTSTVDPNALARAVASALNGMTVVMDGQTVGQIQGRQANLLTRGG